MLPFCVLVYHCVEMFIKGQEFNLESDPIKTVNLYERFASPGPLIYKGHTLIFFELPTSIWTHRTVLDWITQHGTLILFHFKEKDQFLDQKRQELAFRPQSLQSNVCDLTKSCQVSSQIDTIL